jgi:hypothetical protein
VQHFVSEQVWEQFVGAVADQVDLLELGLDGEISIDESLSLTNEALTGAGACLHGIEFASAPDDWGQPLPERDETYSDVYATALVGVAACALRAAAATSPPGLEDEWQSGFQAALLLSDEFSQDQRQHSAVGWHSLVVRQMQKAFETVRILDRAQAGDLEALDYIAEMTEDEGDVGEWARTLPVTFLFVAGAALATIGYACPDGFTFLPEYAFSPPVRAIPEGL